GGEGRGRGVFFRAGGGEAQTKKRGPSSWARRKWARGARGMVHGPRLIFLDEPTNGLDPPARQRMIDLVCEIRDSGKAHILLSSHLLRDVEECCEEILIIRDGRIAVSCNLEEERKANRRFLELETRGDNESFARQIAALGCEQAMTGEHRIKVVMPDGMEVRDLYRIAAEGQVQIRRLSYKRDSLEDIFLKAMEDGNGSL